MALQSLSIDDLRKFRVQIMLYCSTNKQWCKADATDVESLTGQRHDRVQTESQELQPWTAVSTSLGLVNMV